MSELQSILARHLSRLNEVGDNVKSKVERDESPDTVIDQNNNVSIAETREEGVGDSTEDHTKIPMSGDHDDAVWESALARYNQNEHLVDVCAAVEDDNTSYDAEDDIENGIMNPAERDKNVDSNDNDEAIQRSCDVGIQEATSNYDNDNEEEVDDTNTDHVIDNATITSVTTSNTKRYVFSEEDVSNRILSIAKREVNEKKESREVDKLLLESEEEMEEAKANLEETSSSSRRRRPLVICLIVTLVVVVAVVVAVVASTTGKSSEEEKNVKESAMVTMIESSEEPSYSSVPSSSPSLTLLPTNAHSSEPSNPAPSYEPTSSRPSLITLKPRTKEPSISPVTLEPTTDSPTLPELTDSPTVDALGITTSPSVILSSSPTVSCESYVRKKACLRPRKQKCNWDYETDECFEGPLDGKDNNREAGRYPWK